jgi:hypothetical protein
MTGNIIRIFLGLDKIERLLRNKITISSVGLWPVLVIIYAAGLGGRGFIDAEQGSWIPGRPYRGMTASYKPIYSVICMPGLVLVQQQVYEVMRSHFTIISGLGPPSDSLEIVTCAEQSFHIISG